LQICVLVIFILLLIHHQFNCSIPINDLFLKSFVIVCSRIGKFLNKCVFFGVALTNFWKKELSNIPYHTFDFNLYKITMLLTNVMWVV